MKELEKCYKKNNFIPHVKRFKQESERILFL